MPLNERFGDDARDPVYGMGAKLPWYMANYPGWDIHEDPRDTPTAPRFNPYQSGFGENLAQYNQQRQLRDFGFGFNPLLAAGRGQMPSGASMAGTVAQVLGGATGFGLPLMLARGALGYAGHRGMENVQQAMDPGFGMLIPQEPGGALANNITSPTLYGASEYGANQGGDLMQNAAQNLQNPVPSVQINTPVNTPPALSPDRQRIAEAYGRNGDMNQGQLMNGGHPADQNFGFF